MRVGHFFSSHRIYRKKEILRGSLETVLEADNTGQEIEMYSFIFFIKLIVSLLSVRSIVLMLLLWTTKGFV